MIRRSTVVSTKPTAHVLSLSEVKAHLRVDDVTLGAKASVTKGTGSSQLKLTAKFDGVFGNAYTLTIVTAGNNTALSVAVNGNAFTINLATSGLGVATSTVNDVIAAITNDLLVASKISATSGTGAGTGLLAAATVTSFTGGIDGVSPEDDYILALIAAVEGQTQTILRSSLMPQTLELRLDDFPYTCSSIYPMQSLVKLDFGPVQAVNSIKYLDSTGAEQTIASTEYTVDTKSTPAVIALEPAKYWPVTEMARRNAVIIEYDAGYLSAADVPAEIKHAMKLFIGHLFTNRESVQVGPGITTLEIPQAAMWLLWPYRDLRF